MFIISDLNYCFILNFGIILIKKIDFADLNIYKLSNAKNEADQEFRSLMDKFEPYTLDISRKTYIKMI